MLLAAALCFGATPSAHADMLGHATAAYNRGDYIHAARDLSLLAEQGNPRALGLLGFLYEHGYGVPQSYDAAADLLWPRRRSGQSVRPGHARPDVRQGPWPAAGFDPRLQMARPRRGPRARA